MSGAAVPQTFRVQGEPETSSAALPNQASYAAADSSPPVNVDAPDSGTTATDETTPAECLHQEISQELYEHDGWLGRMIFKAGYRDPDLSELKGDTQVRYYRARSKPGFAFRNSPKALLRTCFGKARLDFHRREGRQPEPVEELPESSVPEASELDLMMQREAIKTFLEEHLPDVSERMIYLLTHREQMKKKEIAARLGLDRGTVSKRLERAEKRLKSLPPDVLNAYFLR
ncbi:MULTISPECIES: sigma-70 family RNA polymerase sigma factor [unclassified Streptomyces]|uniref:sigma-70 family RNA polymerase sigma factor n=1 Tax=unclassified Streptomyces TaxID=2593676 RepID=UPI00136B6725|nr:sigma-70 family RNA polymerase sigma factor [Streptomyces sp. XHT-2]MYQ29807.1 sigma-70 family RNA polymerase sigma factor [Streptomyces sp. SID4956]